MPKKQKTHTKASYLSKYTHLPVTLLDKKTDINIQTLNECFDYNNIIMTEFMINIINKHGSLDLFTIGVSFLLFIAAKPICRWLDDNSTVNNRASMMRMLNLAVVVAIITRAVILENNTWLLKITQVLIALYFAMLFTQIINFFVRKRFGKVRVSKGSTSIADTYSSRGLSIFVTVVITIIALVSCLRILGFDSVLEAGGALGIIGLFLAMTQASWAPDIISGLIILNSRLCEEGDVIQLNMDGKPVTASIFRTKLFHTECLDLANNHRLMIRNAKLRDQGLQNLSRFASAKGLREVLYFNIDYQHTEDEISEMIKRAFEKVDHVENVREEQYDPEIIVYETGDYAVTWAIFYYIKDVKRLLSIKHIIRSYILKESRVCGISLSTPILQNNMVELASKKIFPKQATDQSIADQTKEILKSQQPAEK